MAKTTASKPVPAAKRRSGGKRRQSGPAFACAAQRIFSFIEKRDDTGASLVTFRRLMNLTCLEQAESSMDEAGTLVYLFEDYSVFVIHDYRKPEIAVGSFHLRRRFDGLFADIYEERGDFARKAAVAYAVSPDKMPLSRAFSRLFQTLPKGREQTEMLSTAPLKEFCQILRDFWSVCLFSEVSRTKSADNMLSVLMRDNSVLIIDQLGQLQYAAHPIARYSGDSVKSAPFEPILERLQHRYALTQPKTEPLSEPAGEKPDEPVFCEKIPAEEEDSLPGGEKELRFSRKDLWKAASAGAAASAIVITLFFWMSSHVF